MICELLMLAASFTTDTDLRCIAPDDRPEELQHAAGWYNGDTDTVYVVEDLGPRYTYEVLQHELAHAWDLAKGTALNGYPSFFSETHTGFDVESFARLQTLHSGDWPGSEIYPDPIPTASDWEAMRKAGWLK